MLHIFLLQTCNNVLNEETKIKNNLSTALVDEWEKITERRKKKLLVQKWESTTLLIDTPNCCGFEREMEKNLSEFYWKILNIFILIMTSEFELRLLLIHVNKKSKLRISDNEYLEFFFSVQQSILHFYFIVMCYSLSISGYAMWCD